MLFVGEAPGRLGADGSHLPFHGDKSGHNFEKLIEQVGISRYDVFVTNAVLCNPKDERGNNATPTGSEIENCVPFLRETIEILDPSMVVTLGAVALKSCGIVQTHGISLKEGVRSNNRWMNRALIPVYHPGQRAMVHRSFANQLSDYQFIAETLRRLNQSPRRVTSKKRRSGSEKLGDVARQILESHPEGLSYFALHKLCFLAEVACLETSGKRLTNSYVVRQKDGPYFVDLHPAKLPTLVPGIQFRNNSGKLSLHLSSQMQLLSPATKMNLSDQERVMVERVLIKYGSWRDAELKRVVYLSKYMRALLRRERKTGENLYNAAVLPFASLDGE
ncbi:uracil-DNA glycosylase [Variovorax atrisoli]|uniref:uracil-DNA glycosylase n=1 Tax=Variovorax atrisoli TaxID=3394203 RepID=UPI001FC97AA8